MKPILFNKPGHKIIAVLAALSFFIYPSRVKSTIIYIRVENYAFSPSSVVCNVGDTVKWEWVAGTHTTTSTSVPAGAATWSQAMNSNSTTFMYKVLIPGMYNYQCNFHFAMGMVGTISASPSGVAPVEMSNGLMIYPNPVRSNLTIKSHEGNGIKQVSLYSISGQKVYEQGFGEIKPVEDAIDCSEYAQGIYVLQVELENAGTVTKKITLVK